METPSSPPPEHRSLVGLVLRLAALTLVAGLLALLVWRVVNAGQGGRLVNAVREHKNPIAPDFRLGVLWPHTETWPPSTRDLVTSKVALRSLRGRPVVLNFWASWCIPCAHEAPRLVESAKAHEGRVLFLGVDVKDFSSDARKFLRRFHVDYVSVRDGGSSVYDAYGLTGLPESYFLDARGRIVAHKIGEISAAELEDGIRQALGEAP
ncbi:MAG TPA: TlpA disulfide reductase family protein [Gaiellaceae bacterium]|nr:TlpA disulfide reductase family protein [Gaiellaceae bacterium]